MREYRNLIANTYSRFTPIAKNLTEDYEHAYGLPCDIYFPKRDPKKKGTYQAVNLFEPHELPSYADTPSAENVYYYIPNLIQKESMNSVSEQFDNFALMTEGKTAQPFIETTTAKQLPLATKVVVKLGVSTLQFYVIKKTTVNGAGGHMVLRMYLAPLTKGKQKPNMGSQEKPYKPGEGLN